VAVLCNSLILQFDIYLRMIATRCYASAAFAVMQCLSDSEPISRFTAAAGAIHLDATDHGEFVDGGKQ